MPGVTATHRRWRRVRHKASVPARAAPARDRGNFLQPTISDKPRPLHTLSIAVEGPMETILASLPEYWGRLSAHLAALEVHSAGAPFIRYCTIDMPRWLAVEVGLPMPHPVAPATGMSCGALPAGRYAEVVHVGPYDGLMQTTAQLLQWGEHHRVVWDCEPTNAGEVWAGRVESYLTDPSQQTDPQQWRTLLSIKIKEGTI